MDLNVQDWKEFRVGDLFECSNGTMYDNLTTEPDENAVEYYTSSESNNGFEGYLNDYDEKDVIRVPSLTVGSRGNDAITYYHSEPYIANQNLTVLIPKQHISQFAMLFFATVLYQEKPKYSYGRLMSKEKTRDSIIKLPVDANGTPDWQFMEDYIKSLHSEPITTTRGAAESLSLGVDKWEEFIVDELFDLVPTKGKDSTELTEGMDIPYIAAKHDENGLMMVCQKQGYEDWISQGNCIVFVNLGAGSAGYTNYIQEDFIGMSGKTTCGYIKDVMTPNIGIFISTILSAERPKYSFGRSWTGDRLMKTILKLPVQRDALGNPVIDPDKKYSDKGYIPDWDFMERYIDSLPYSDKIA